MAAPSGTGGTPAAITTVATGSADGVGRICRFACISFRHKILSASLGFSCQLRDGSVWHMAAENLARRLLSLRSIERGTVAQLVQGESIPPLTEYDSSSEHINVALPRYARPLGDSCSI
jgi:hypothetical protein